jgi:hypothetical protein
MARRKTPKSPEDRNAADGVAPSLFRSSFRSTIAINADLLMATGCGFVAWAIWPDEPEWWGLGLMSIMLGISAVGCLGRAIRSMAAVYSRDKTVAKYMAQGGEAKSARLATADDLTHAGMLDD